MLVTAVLSLLLSTLAVATAYGEAGSDEVPSSTATAADVGETPSPEPSVTEPAEGGNTDPEGDQGDAVEEPATEPDPDVPEEATEGEAEGIVEEPVEASAETEVEGSSEEEVKAQAPGDEETSLQLDASGSNSLATVGQHIDYSIEVGNPGPIGLHDVEVQVNLAPELRGASAGGAVEGELVPTGALWLIPVLEPGDTLQLSLDSQVVSEGGLHAESEVIAESREADRETVDLDTYIGARRGRAVTNPEPEIFQKVSFLRPREVTVRVPDGRSASALPSVLPATGVPIGLPLGLLLGIAVALLSAGGLVLARATGLIKATGARSAVLLLLVLTACTPDVERPAQEAVGPTPTQAASPTTGDDTDADEEEEEDEDEGDDEVKGSLITRDGEGDGDVGSVGGGTDEGGTGVADGAVPGDPTGGTTTQTVVVYDEVTRTEKVPTSQIPLRTLGSHGGDNAISLDWSGTDVISQSSSTIFDREAVATLMTTQRESGDTLVAQLTLTNQLERERLGVRGSFVHEIAGSGFAGTLTSEPIDVVLNPNGTTTYTFNYALPPGSYSVASRFEAS